MANLLGGANNNSGDSKIQTALGEALGVSDMFSRYENTQFFLLSIEFY